MRWEGKLRPVEILDRAMQPALDKQDLRIYLDLQGRDWLEIEDWGEELELGE